MCELSSSWDYSSCWSCNYFTYALKKTLGSECVVSEEKNFVIMKLTHGIIDMIANMDE